MIAVIFGIFILGRMYETFRGTHFCAKSAEATKSFVNIKTQKLELERLGFKFWSRFFVGILIRISFAAFNGDTFYRTNDCALIARDTSLYVVEKPVARIARNIIFNIGVTNRDITRAVIVTISNFSETIYF